MEIVAKDKSNGKLLEPELVCFDDIVVKTDFLVENNLSDGFARVEAKQVMVSKVFMNAKKYQDVRSFRTFDVETKAVELMKGNMGSMWAAQFHVDSGVKPDEILVCGADDYNFEVILSETEGEWKPSLTGKTERPIIYVQRLIIEEDDEDTLLKDLKNDIKRMARAVEHVNSKNDNPYQLIEAIRRFASKPYIGYLEKKFK
jgi:hypothetical protein